MTTSTREILTGAQTMWELVERRAQASGDHPMLIAPDGETLTFGQFRDRAERVAAGLHAMGDHHRIRRLVAAAHPHRHGRALHRADPARRGAEPDHPPLPRARGRLRPPPDRRHPLRAPRHLARHRLRRAGRPRPRGRRHEDRRSSPPRAACPKPTPPPCPPPPPGSPAADAPIRWIYYTSGSTADPKGVQHTDQTLIAGGWGLARALDMGPDDIGSIAFPYAHIGGPDYLVSMLSMGFPAVLLEAFSAPDALEVFNRHGATVVGGSTAFYVAYLVEQRKQPGTPVLPTLRIMVGGGAAKPPELHYEVRDEIGGRGVVHGYGMTEVPMIANGSPHDTDEQLANTDGAPVERRRRPYRPARRPAGRARRGGRDQGQGPDGLPRLHRPRTRPRARSTRTATSAPATSAGCGRTAISP